MAFNLEREGYEVRVAVDGEQALAAARDPALDLIVLDVMLPGMNGLEVLRVVRADGLDTPVIVLSAKGQEVDRIVGLKVGADDYVSKPFSRPELLARIEAVLRRRRLRTTSDATSAPIRSGDLLVDVARRLATHRGEPMPLTTREFDLLAHLAASPERIFTREQLLDRLWGPDYIGDQRTVDVHVSWLRTKLRERDGHDYFRTVRGVGYAFEPRTDPKPRRR